MKPLTEQLHVLALSVLDVMDERSVGCDVERQSIEDEKWLVRRLELRTQRNVLQSLRGQTQGVARS